MEMRNLIRGWLFGVIAVQLLAPMAFAEQDSEYYHDGDLAGSLKTEGPLAVYDPDPQHVWNRLFSAFYRDCSIITAD